MTVTVNLPGNVPMQLVKINTFQMGSPAAERGRNANEDPPHQVTIGRDFFVGRTEVTQKQWLAVMGSWPGAAPSSQYGLGDDYPAYYVSWNDIAGPGGFIEKLNQYLVSSGQGSQTFRLPTEAEWEYCCRAGTTTRFFFGDSLGVDDKNTDGATDSVVSPGRRSDYMWFTFNCQGNANGALGGKPVGMKLPNAWGLYDMAGNEWEWCQDFWGNYSSASQTDPTGPGTGTNRVIRGGSWHDNAAQCRSATRGSSYLTDRYPYIGFRLLRTP